MEAGIKGFWWSYPAINQLLQEVGINESDVFTPWSTSGFWAPRAGGPAELINQAPVFSKLPRLPTPLGQMVGTAGAFTTLSLADRLSVIGSMAALVDVDSSPERRAALDKMSARELFVRLGVTEAVYRDFLCPTLQVAVFAPPEQLSAAETLKLLNFYALQHQESFDVRWCRGSVADKIFAPLVKSLTERGAQCRFGTAAARVDVDGDRATRVITADGDAIEADTIIFAVGIKGMQALVSASPGLAARPEFRAINTLRTIDCISARLFFDAPTPTRFPCNVLAGFDGANVGGTFFNLNALQDDFKAPNAEGVVHLDWYGASELIQLSDDQLVERAVTNLIACEPGFKYRTLVDSAVARARGAVTHFSPGSLEARPTQTTSLANAFIAGDYVKDVDTIADGLSQERALVTGLIAAGLACDAVGVGRRPTIPQPEPDEPHIAAAKRAAKTVRGAVGKLGLRGPWLQ